MFSPSSFKENSDAEFVELGAVNFSYLNLQPSETAILL